MRLLLLVLASLVAVPAASADVGVRLETTTVRVGGVLRAVAYGSGAPIYVVPAALAPYPHACGSRAVCDPRTKRPPRGRYVVLGRLRRTANPYARQRVHFRVPRLAAGRYKVVMWCRPCGGSLILAGDTLRGQTLRVVR